MTTWSRIAGENETVEVPANSLLRYGVSAQDRYVERVMSGLVTADNATFGDPARGVQKALFLLAAEQPPAPAPQPEPPADPQMPALTDPDFDRKARIYEAWQRDRTERAWQVRHAEHVRVTVALTTAHDRAAAAMERTLNEGIPTDQPMVEAITDLRKAIEAVRA